MTSPTPTATPSTGNAAADALSKAFAAENVGGTTSTSTGDLYGLADWGSQTINPGDLGNVTLGLLSTGTKTTGDQIVKAFAGGDPQSVAQIQRALYLGGYYDKTYTPTYGVVKPADITAFGNAVTVSGQTGTSVSDTLLQGAQYGTQAGIAAAKAATPSPKTVAVKLPNTQDLEAEATSAFQQVLGRKATPSEAAAFAASYRSMVAGVERGNAAAVYGAASQNGLSASQALTLQQKAQDVGANVPVAGPLAPGEERQDGSIVTPQAGPLAPGESRPVTVDQQAAPPSFGDQLNSLGDIANQASQEALPASADAGLRQVDETTPESADVAAQNFARNEDPKEARGGDVANTFAQFLSILGGNFGGAG